MSVLDALLFFTLAVGSFAAAAALYGRYRVLPAWLTGPQICSLEAGGCVALFRTREAALLGVPNALLGLMAYLGIFAGILLNASPFFLLAISTPGLCVTFYLAWYLLSHHLQCRICWTGHAANTILWVVLLWKCIPLAS